jgi:hypothetical protein
MLNTFTNPEFRLSEQNFSKKWFGLMRFVCMFLKVSEGNFYTEQYRNIMYDL